VAWAQRAEALGYDHLWVYDHVETVPRRERTHCFEAFTMLAALSQRTERVELGQLVTCVGYRNVGLLAKEAAGIDVMSGGRLILGLGAGWYEREYEAYGYPYPPARERLGLLDEALQVIPRLWSEETVDFDGRFVHLDGAYCEPQPVRSPRPPILVGGGGEQVTLRIAARHADLTNWQVGLESFVHKSGLLARYCEEVDRDPASIVRTHGPDCLIVESEAELQAWLDSADGGHLWGGVPHDQYLRDNFVGTVEQVAEQAQAYLDAGCSEFVLWFRDAPSDRSLTAWMEGVVPLLRG
jgi:F420-dependent oxidoreductase-like protein